MNRKRWIVIVALTFAMVFGVSTGFAYVRTTITQHNGACGKLTGFPGVLQSMHFISSGNCPLAKGSTTTCQSTSACTITNPASGLTTKGKCTQLTDSKGKNTACACQ